MESLRLYRGICVEPHTAEAIKMDIITNGIQADAGTQWQMQAVDLRCQLSTLFDKSDLCRDDTWPTAEVRSRNSWARKVVGGFPVVCACGDILGASYYALSHNVMRRDNRTHGLLITFDAALSHIQVDGRDFLYNSVFRDGTKVEQRALACRLFGNELGIYLDKACVSETMDYKFAMCDLAVQDPRVVLAHARNKIVIGGRCGTRFCSAFMVRLPIRPEQIISVEDAQHVDDSPEVTIESFAYLGLKCC